MSDDPTRDQDERASVEGVCGVIRRTQRFEFICIRREHASTERPDLASRHYYVNRWPNRTVGSHP